MVDENNLTNEEPHPSGENPVPQNPAVPADSSPPASASSESEYLIPESMRKLDALLKEIKLRKTQPPPTPSRKDATPSENTNTQLVNLMQGKLDAMGDKIADRIAVLMSELKYAVGPAREAKIKEITEIAGPDIIDISKLFDEKIASNLGEIGIEEKEAKEVDKSLERLRKLRGLNKPDK